MLGGGVFFGPRGRCLGGGFAKPNENIFDNNQSNHIYLSFAGLVGGRRVSFIQVGGGGALPEARGRAAADQDYADGETWREDDGRDNSGHLHTGSRGVVLSACFGGNVNVNVFSC